MESPIQTEEAHFDAARLLSEPAARRRYLDEACPDPAVRARVEALLQVHDSEQSFLRPLAALAPVELPAASERPGTMIGPYKLLERVGGGGMGEVWMAEQTQPVRRKVAVKVIKPGMDSAQVVARFEAERQALALMDHPNIARVLDGGTTDRGRPFFVMELVKGVPITRYADDHKMPVRDRLRLFADVCRAVQHAHQKGIIHRDLKPNNVLVAPYDGRPVVKVIDFGVAKATGSLLTERTLFTAFGAIIGTPEYMSPEQAEVNNQDVDTRSDVYALGVLLYELLTGSTPLTRQRVKDAVLLEVLRLVREEEPPKPSTRLSSTAELPSIAAVRGVEPKGLYGLLRGELDWIVMRALEKHRDRRYETANGLAMDVERYLAGEAVQAVPPSAGYRLRKLLRRHRVPALAAALVFTALLAGLAATGLSLGVARSEREAADRAGQTAIDERDKALAADRRSRERLFAASLARAEAVRRVDRPGRRFEALAALSEAVNAARELGTLPEHRLELRNEVIAALSIPLDFRRGHQWEGWPVGITSLVFDPALEHYARADSEGVVTVRRVVDNQELARIPAVRSDIRVDQGFSPDGRYLVLHGTYVGLFLTRIVDWRNRQTVFSYDQGSDTDHDKLGWIAWSPDGTRFTVQHQSVPGYRLYDATTGKQLLKVNEGGPYYGIHFHPAGKVFAAVSKAAANRVQVIEVDTGKVVDSITTPVPVQYAGWGGPDGRRLAAFGGTDAYVWDMTRRSEPPVPVHHGMSRGVSASFHVSGDLLMTTSWDDTTRFWDVATGVELMHSTEVAPLLRSTKSFGDRIPARFGGSTVGFWEMSRFHEGRWLRAPTGPAQLTGVHFSPDGRWVTQWDSSGLVRFWDVGTAAPPTTQQLGGSQQPLFNPRGHELYTLDSQGLRRWPIRYAADTTRIGPPIPMGPTKRDGWNEMAVDAGGHRLAVTENRWIWRLYDLDAGGVELTNATHLQVVRIAVSPDLRWVATSTYSEPRSTRVWDLATSPPVSRDLFGGSFLLQFSRDGKWLCTSAQFEHRFWQAGTWQPGPVIQNHREIGGGFVQDEAGTMLAFRRTTQTIRLVDGRFHQELATFEPPDTPYITHWSLSPDGGFLSATHSGKDTILWDLRAVRARLTEFGLDWDTPPLPVALPATPVTVTIDPDGSPQALVDYLTKRLAETPADAQMYADRAQARWRLGQKSSAVADLSEAIRREPGAAQFHVLRADFYTQLKDHTLAAADLRRAIELRSQANAGDYIRLGNVLGELGDRPGQLDAIRTAVRIDPNTYPALGKLGVELRDAGRLSEAIALLEESLDRARGLKPSPVDLHLLSQNLGEAYDRAGQWTKSEPLYRENVQSRRAKVAAVTGAAATAAEEVPLSNDLAALGLNLLRQQRWGEAEIVLRDSRALREKHQPDVWNTFNARSMLGGALLGQKKYAEAEPLLLAGYEGMKERATKIPPVARDRIPEALERLVHLYEALEKKDEAAKWRTELARSRAPVQLAPPPREVRP